MAPYFWKPYVPVAQRRAKAAKEVAKLRKKGADIRPVVIDGRKIASSFWGKGWCDHLESFSDYANRLPRGRTYVRNGSVCHLDIQEGHIEARVSGSSVYKISINIRPLDPEIWESIKTRCQGQIGSVLELLQGKMSDHVMEVVSNRTEGLFPKPDEIEMVCSCPDWAIMCKHVAAVLYGIGNRLDYQPELLFVLRAVNAADLTEAIALPTAAEAPDALNDDSLADIFGVDIDTGNTAVEIVEEDTPKHVGPAKRSTAKRSPAKRSAATRSTPRKRGGRRTSVAPAVSAGAPTGKAIARLRKRAKLSAAAFANILGVSPASIHRWENTAGPLRLHAHCIAALKEFEGKNH